MSGALITIFLSALSLSAMVAWARRDSKRQLTTNYASDLRTLKSNWLKLGVVVGFIVFISAPIGFSWIGYGSIHLPGALIPGLPLTKLGIGILNFGGVFAIGTMGLNVLTGYAGQVSLGHSAFIAAGAYAGGYFGTDLKPFGHHLPFLVWLTLAGFVGGLIAMAVGPFALRLRGDYLAVITVGMLIFSEHVFNAWTSVTGGTIGRELPQPVLTVFPGKSIVFTEPGTPNSSIFGFTFSREQAFFWLIWAFVVLGALVTRNIVRSRQGRALMAVRDRDLSAEAIGVEIAGVKIRAFALCGALAGVSGAIYGGLIQNVTTEFFGLNLSIQYVAMMVVGGAGTILGPILGSVAIVAFKQITTEKTWVFQLPVVRNILFFVKPEGKPNVTATGLSGAFKRLYMSPINFAQFCYGIIIIVTLIYFPNGLAALWVRIKTYFKRWPFAS